MDFINGDQFGATTMNKALENHNRIEIEMRKQNKIVLWPAYFDSNKTRMEGRRVPKKLAVPSPKLEEIQRAVKRMGLRPEMVPDAVHPSSPCQKTGLLIIPKKCSKVETLRKIAKELLDIRG